jgi:hypothetical protein
LRDRRSMERSSFRRLGMLPLGAVGVLPVLLAAACSDSPVAPSPLSAPPLQQASVAASASANPAEPASLSTLDASGNAAGPELLSAESAARGWRGHKGTVTLTCENIITDSTGSPKPGVDCHNEASPTNRLHIAVAGHSLRRGGTVEYYWGVQTRVFRSWDYCPEPEYHHRGGAGTLKNVDMTQKRQAWRGATGTFLYKGGNVVRWRAPNDFAEDVRVCVVAVRTGTKRTQTAEGCYTVRVAQEIYDPKE